MKAWLVKPGETEPTVITVTSSVRVLTEVSHAHFNRRILDLTKVIFLGRVCNMAVDDEGHLDGLPINSFATDAYHLACTPGTTHEIRGPAVIFDGLLP